MPIYKIDQVLEILRATNDGANLAPRHMGLIQEAINDNLSEFGEKGFTELYRQVVTDKTYDKNTVYYYDVEFMTKDHEGYIYFKGIHVEHYSYGRNDSAEEIAALKTLRNVCLMLESKGIEVSSITALWHKDKHLTPDEIKQCKVLPVASPA